MSLTKRRLYPARPPNAPVPSPLLRDVIDHEGDSLEGVRVAQAVLEVERPVARDQPAVVDLDREAGRPPADLRAGVETGSPPGGPRRGPVRRRRGGRLFCGGR